ncbi:MAG: ribonuclease Y [Verrucomicrobia bacterium]|nr:ribonuclease Y [Verrucomicrobiota bacterium]
MTWLSDRFVESAVLALTGALIGYWISRWRERSLGTAISEKAEEVLEKARRDADTIVRESRLTGTEEAAKLREQTEKSFSAQRRELAELEGRLSQREALINEQLEGLVSQEKSLRAKTLAIEQREADLDARNQEILELQKLRKEQLQRLSHLSEEEARSLLLKEIEQGALKDATELTRHILESAKSKADEQARRIIGLAIQRYAGSHSFETTTATVALQGDDVKGRIIGREGRNIRAFEAATGVTVLIDDTPSAVVISGFDPVRREIAREAMQRLILDGRIHPTRIEEVVAKVTQEIDEAILKAGEEAVFKLGLAPMHAELVKVLGRLRFRYSFSQNILDHSIEVAHLTGLMAAEIGADVTAAKRTGLLHDIGKAINHEVEGSHAIVGADLIKRYGEAEDVVNGVASHHGEVPHSNVLGVLVSAADAISASRPGARSETVATYIKRLENLEQIGLSFPGVDKCFAVQAGRELRVVVHPDQVSDEQAFALARNLARKIEGDLHYPGQIRVTVVRETRCVEFAK